jgi:hypothetical protein
VSEIRVARWKRFGQDRLYVNGPSGALFGWVDLVNGSRVIADADCERDFTAAVDQWYADGAAATAQPAVATIPTWHDLATHEPGQAARRQAHRLAAEQHSTVGALFAKVLDIKTDERNWRVGADGEVTVGRKLAGLGADWHVLHAVPVGNRGSDVDHVVVGPGGVWTVNTKMHPGAKVWVGDHAVLVNGHSVPYLRNSRHEAERAGRLLSAVVGFDVSVNAALVILTGTLIPQVTIKQQPAGVVVLGQHDIPSYFSRSRRRVSPSHVEAIYEAARRCTTWTRAESCECHEPQMQVSAGR